MTKEQFYDLAIILIIIILLSLAFYSYGNGMISANRNVIWLNSFNVEKVGNGNKLKWTTYSSNYDHCFILEKSFNGQDFVPFKSIKGECSTSESLVMFSFLDECTESDYVTYRIKAYMGDFSHDAVSKIPVSNMENLFEYHSYSIICLNENQCI